MLEGSRILENISSSVSSVPFCKLNQMQKIQRGIYDVRDGSAVLNADRLPRLFTVMIYDCEFVCVRWFCHLHCKRAAKIATRIDTVGIVKCLGVYTVYFFAGAPCPSFLFSPVVGAVAHRRLRRWWRRWWRWRRWRGRWGRARGFWHRGRRPCGGGGVMRSAVSLSRGSGRPRRRPPAASPARGISAAAPLAYPMFPFSGTILSLSIILVLRLFKPPNR